MAVDIKQICLVIASYIHKIGGVKDGKRQLIHEC